MYESSTALGFKKSISIEQGKHEMFQKMRELEQGKFKLDDEVKGLFQRYNALLVYCVRLQTSK